MRLQKAIAHAGIASRRKAEELILEGKVAVNGEIVTRLGTRVTGTDTVEVNGVPIQKETPVYFIFYKPRGVISSVTDDKGRKTVTDFFGHVEERIYPVGRLDYDTSGLLLLTNDGEFAHQLMHPKNEVSKSYVAKVQGIPTREALRLLEYGIILEDGKTAPARVKMTTVDRKRQTAIVEITIHEGKNRQVRRMFEKIGCPVMKLKRERYGTLTLRGLNTGDYRELTPHEVKQLHVVANRNN